MRKIINSPSLANCPFLEFRKYTDELAEGGVPWFHIDIMDGHYVPNLCFPVRILGELKRQYPQIMLDVHLMVTNPMDYLPQLRDNGADYVSFHMDATNFARRALASIREMGMRAGVVINPSQRVDVVEPFIGSLDYAVLMTVEPGYAGQRFMPDGLARVSELNALRKKHDAGFLISVDGGIDYISSPECLRCGAEVFVTNIYTVFNQPDPIPAACRRFQKALEDALVGGGGK